MTKSAAARKRARARKALAKKAQVAPQPVVQQPITPRVRNRRFGAAVQAGLNRSVPFAYPSVLGNRVSGVVRHSGTDYIDLEAVSSDVVDGSVLLELDISPTSLAGTHLSVIAAAFEKFRFLEFDVDVITRAATVVGGGYLAGITPDVYQTLQGGLLAKRYVRALTGSMSAPWYQSVRVRGRGSMGTDPWYYTSAGGANAEKFKRVQGRFFLIVDGPPSGGAGTISVSLQVCWRVELTSPATSSDQSDEFEVEAESFAVNETKRLSLSLTSAKPGWLVFLRDPNILYHKVWAIHPPLIDAQQKQFGYFQVSYSGSALLMGVFSTLDAAFKTDYYNSLAGEAFTSPITALSSSITALGEPRPKFFQKRILGFSLDVLSEQLKALSIDERKLLVEVVGGLQNLETPPVVVAPLGSPAPSSSLGESWSQG